MGNKLVSTGIDSFRELIESNGYYVDKTLMIDNFLSVNNKVTLIRNSVGDILTPSIVLFSNDINITSCIFFVYFLN